MLSKLNCHQSADTHFSKQSWLTFFTLARIMGNPSFRSMSNTTLVQVHESWVTEAMFSETTIGIREHPELLALRFLRFARAAISKLTLLASLRCPSCLRKHIKIPSKDQYSKLSMIRHSISHYFSKSRCFQFYLSV